MKRRLSPILALTVLLAAACTPERLPSAVQYDSVFIYCALGYNNLNSALRNDLEELRSGELPHKGHPKAAVAFCHNLSGDGSYTTPNSPVLLQICEKDGATVLDTLKIYPPETVSASPETIRQMLTDVRELFPSKSYGMLFSSHATGWIPAGYRTDSESSGRLFSTSALAVPEESSGEFPLTKSVGAQYYRKSGTTYAEEMDLREFAGAIPMKMDYMIFDACLMGGVEVAWELKDICDRLVISPAEIISDGMVYSSMLHHLLAGTKPDLKAICEEYFDYYNSQSGNSRSATISLVECSGLRMLAKVCAGIISDHREKFDAIDRNAVQPYFYDRKKWYFDLRDALLQMELSPYELANLEGALEGCISYHAETEYFFNIRLERCCGLSVYLPDPDRPGLNDYYKTLGWNEATGLVQ